MIFPLLQLLLYGHVIVSEGYKLGRKESWQSDNEEHEDHDLDADYRDECYEKCHLQIDKESSVREMFHKHVEDKEIKLIHFHVHFPNHSSPALETYPYMKSSYKASRWVWATRRIGKRLLELPSDADVLSLHLLDFKVPVLRISVVESPPRCFIMLTSNCRLVAIRTTVAKDIVLKGHPDNDSKLIGTYLCHYQFINTDVNVSSLVHRCCSISEIENDGTKCQFVVHNKGDFLVINIFSFSMALIITLYSPMLVIRLKHFLVFEKSTKFFRASLKHGITGQCSYVIRISYRQLVNLNDSTPFSLPRSLLRLLFHCYGEGRCCIHWWGSWPYQPSICMPNSKFKKCWFFLLKALGVLLVYPWALHLAVIFYFPRLSFYKEIIDHTSSSPDIHPAKLHFSILGLNAILPDNFALGMWILFSLVAFFYTLLLLSRNDTPIERYILTSSGKKPINYVKSIQKQFNDNYKSILRELAYGTQDNTLRHFFQLPWKSPKLKRIVKAGIETLGAFIPIVNVCASLYPKSFYKSREISLEGKNGSSPTKCFKAFASSFIWLVFSLLLFGYCTIVFLIVEFCLKVTFFVVLSCLIYPSTLFPWLCFAVSLFFYANDFLSHINHQHRFILNLIDENSPRLSAIDENDIEESSVHLLKAHSLGSVKFIDGDGTEYVSKELYYGVCDDLKYGWSRCLRTFAKKMFMLVLYMMAVLLVVKMFNFLWSNEGTYAILITVGGAAVPKMLEVSFKYKNKFSCQRMRWSKIIPDVLDRHIKVDRIKSARVEGEEYLSTYDVRPVGCLELELPRHCAFRTLDLWKFPWLVSCEQQTQTTEFYVNSLANRIAAVSFLVKAVSKNLPEKIDTEASLRNWTMMIESCILESSSKALSLHYAPFSDSTLLFPPDLQPLLFSIDAGNSVDSLVDNINRELYGFYVNAVLANINTSSCAILKIGNNKLMAFNGSCHADHFSDFYGAVLIITDFNAQNLQLLIKFLMDHQHPDSVPVYSPLAAEAFVLRSAEVLDIESVV